MNFRRIFAIIHKSVLLMSRDLLQITDLVYWPTLDIVIWGFNATWISSQNGTNAQPIMIILTSFTLLHVMSRAHMDVALSLINELWDKNLVNLFSSPISIREWATGVMILGVSKGMFTLFFCTTIIWLLYGLNILTVGWVLVPFLIALIFCGWSLGFFTAGLLLYFGQKAQNFIWSLLWLLAAICGVFYPVSVLPKAIQYISAALPMTYAFEGVRFAIISNTTPVNYILISLILSVGYFVASRMFFNKMFQYSIDRGLSRLEYE